MKVIVIGDGCESEVVQDIITQNRDEVYKVLHSDKEIDENEKEYYYVIAIGNNHIRKKIYEEHKDLKYYTAVHPTAMIGKNVTIGKGCIVHADAFINQNTKIGNFCLIGTKGILEHCNILEDYVNIGCGAVVSGDVVLRKLVQISLNASIVNGCHINKNNLIGAGATVCSNIIPTNGVYVGCPAKYLRENVNGL